MTTLADTEGHLGGANANVLKADARRESLALLALCSPGLLLVCVIIVLPIGWLFWRVWSHRPDDGSFPAPPPLGPDHRPDGAERRPGESILRYLRWLAGPQ